MSASSDTADHTLPTRPWRRRTTAWSQIVNHEYKGSGTEADPYVVTWLDGDVENPMTGFSMNYKWGMTMLGAIGTLAVSMGSSMLSAAVTAIEHAFPGKNNMLYIMITGIYVLGFVVGPLLWAPCSEVVGRRRILIWSYFPFTAFCAAVCGAKDLNTLLVLRFFAGTFGSSTMTNSGGIIADMFDAQTRGLAMGVFSIMPFLGPTIGPVAGGFLSQNAKWEWVAAIIAAFAGVLTIVSTVLLPETYAPVLLRNRAATLSKVTGDVYRSQHDVAKPLLPRQLFLNQLRIPYVLLFTEPVVLLTSLYLSVVYAILYMEFTAFPIVFQRYRGWSPGIAGLAFVGVAVGAFMALGYIIFWVNPAYAKLHKERGYVAPEERLKSAMVGAVLFPVGLGIFAGTCVPVSIPWIAPILGTVPYGAGLVLLFLCFGNYLVDSYLLLAASVLAGGTVMRSILGVVFPLFTSIMYTNLGPNWASALVAFIALAFTPCPFFLYIYGRKLRRLTQAGRDADDLGFMIVKMMAAQAAATAGGAGAGGGTAGGELTRAKTLEEVERGDDTAGELALARSISQDHMDEETAMEAMVELVRTETRQSLARQASRKTVSEERVAEKSHH